MAFSLERSGLTVSGGPVWTPVPVGRAEGKGLTGTAPRSSCSLRRAPAFSDLFESAGSPERRTWVRVVVGVVRRTEEVVEERADPTSVGGRVETSGATVGVLGWVGSFPDSKVGGRK